MSTLVLALCSQAYQCNFQQFFCFLCLLKIFMLMGSFSFQNVAHEHFMKIARCLKMKSVKYDSVYLIGKL